MFFVVDLQSDTEYKVRVLAGTSVGFPKLSESQWPWLKHRTPKHNEGPKGSLTRNSCLITLLLRYQENTLKPALVTTCTYLTTYAISSHHH